MIPNLYVIRLQDSHNSVINCQLLVIGYPLTDMEGTREKLYLSYGENKRYRLKNILLPDNG